MKIKIILFLIITTITSLYPISLHLKLSKYIAYLNEPIIATLTLKYKKDENITDIKIDDFKANNIISKYILENNSTNKNSLIKEIKYILYPKKIADLYIPPQIVKVATKDKKLQQISWKKIYSNEQTLSVKNIPNKTIISGNLNIETKIKKLNYQANEPIELIITIYGKGALDSIKLNPIKLKEQTIFNEKPIIQESIKNNNILNKYIQKFVIISDKNFTIPPIKLTYFNTDTQMLEYLSTKPINISIKNTHNNIKESNILKIKIIYTIAGLLLGLAIYIIIYLYKKFKKNKNIELKTKIKKAKTNKELYITLLPLINKYNLENLIKDIENNIESNQNFKQYKKKVIKSISNLSESVTLTV